MKFANKTKNELENQECLALRSLMGLSQRLFASEEVPPWSFVSRHIRGLRTVFIHLPIMPKVKMMETMS